MEAGAEDRIAALDAIDPGFAAWAEARALALVPHGGGGLNRHTWAVLIRRIMAHAREDGSGAVVLEDRIRVGLGVPNFFDVERNGARGFRFQVQAGGRAVTGVNLGPSSNSVIHEGVYRVAWEATAADRDHLLCVKTLGERGGRGGSARERKTALTNTDHSPPPISHSTGTRTSAPTTAGAAT